MAAPLVKALARRIRRARQGRSARAERAAARFPHICPKAVGADLPQPGRHRPAAHNTFAAGDTVDHKTFGRGKVLKVDGDSLVIKFARTGQTKTLLKDYAPIVKIN